MGYCTWAGIDEADQAYHETEWGIMPESVRQICELAFDRLDIVRITGLVYVPYVASQRVLEKMVLFRKDYSRVRGLCCPEPAGDFEQSERSFEEMRI